MLKVKSFLEYLNLFSTSKYEKNNNTKNFSINFKKDKIKKSIALFVVNTKNSKIRILQKALFEEWQ